MDPVSPRNTSPFKVVGSRPFRPGLPRPPGPGEPTGPLTMDQYPRGYLPSSTYVSSEHTCPGTHTTDNSGDRRQSFSSKVSVSFRTPTVLPTSPSLHTSLVPSAPVQSTPVSSFQTQAQVHGTTLEPERTSAIHQTPLLRRLKINPFERTLHPSGQCLVPKSARFLSESLDKERT